MNISQEMMIKSCSCIATSFYTLYFSSIRVQESSTKFWPPSSEKNGKNKEKKMVKLEVTWILV